MSYSNVVSNTVFFFDISKKGKDLAGTKDLSVLYNNQCILESIKNIIMTEPGQHCMQPDFGCPLNTFLFSDISNIQASHISLTIKNSLTQFENRIKDVAVTVLPDEENYTYNIEITFTTFYTNNPEKLLLTLKAIR